MRTRSMLGTSLQGTQQHRFQGPMNGPPTSEKLYLGMSANKPTVSNATTQVDHLPQFVFNVLFDLFESGILEEALRHYRAHCQKQQNSVQGRRRMYHEHSQEASAVDLRRAGRGIFMTMLRARAFLALMRRR